ncbi:MAG: hypothetical protein FWG14_09745 [Peptococcaceae bacterium]|nr:hypothetical protein [Peptococcaceae bacterium]
MRTDIPGGERGGRDGQLSAPFARSMRLLASGETFCRTLARMASER